MHVLPRVRRCHNPWMIEDPRFKIYDDLHHGQLAREEEVTRASARRILNLLFDYGRPNSILDVGCGRGIWLQVAREMGVDKVRGVDGEWLDLNVVAIDPALITRIDLEKP